MSPKYKKGDILHYRRLHKQKGSADSYYYVKSVTAEGYKLGTLNKYEDLSYVINSIDNNPRISLSLSEMLKRL